MRLLCPNKSSIVLIQCTIGGLIVLAGSLKAQDIPELSRVGQGAYQSGELVYSLDNKPTPQCHASTIEEINHGVIAAWLAVHMRKTKMLVFGPPEISKDHGPIPQKWPMALKVTLYAIPVGTRYCFNPHKGH